MAYIITDATYTTPKNVSMLLYISLSWISHVLLNFPYFGGGQGGEGGWKIVILLTVVNDGGRQV